MAKSISASVGLHGVNRDGDVRVVQQLLNQVPSTFGGAAPLLEIDGKCGPLTIGAIQKFQLHHFGWSGCDGRVDPGRQTLAKLNEYDTVPGVTPPVTPPPEPVGLDFVIVPSYQFEVFSQPLTSSQFTYLVLDVTNNRQRVYQLQFGVGGAPSPGPFQGWFSRFRAPRPTGVSGFEGPAAYMTTQRTDPGPPSRSSAGSTLALFLPQGGGISIPMKTHLVKPAPIPGTGGTMTNTRDGTFMIVV